MRQRKVQIMGDSDAELAGLRLFAKHGEAMKLLLDIEEGRGLIQQQDRSVLCETGSQKNALALTSAQRPKVPMAILPAMGSLHGFTDEAVVFVGLEPSIRVRISSHRDELLGGIRKIGVNGLWQMTDPLRELAQIPGPLIAACDGDRSCRGFAEPGDDVEQRALAGSVHSNQGEELATLCAQGRGTQDDASPV